MSNGIPRFKNCAVAGLVVMAALFLCATPSSGQADELHAANNLAVAGPNRPANVPEWYVITPFGYFHPSCVRQLAEGETLLADGRVEHEDGLIEPRATVCNYPHYTFTGLLVTSGRDLPIISGWLEYISATTSTSYGEIAATWTVPPQPSTNHGQTIFFFPGLEDINDVESILQPVLQWYAPGPWAIASWNCCMKGVAWESTPKKVSPGDTILGTITPTCEPGSNYCATWKVVSEDETTGKKTTLGSTPSDGQVWNWGFGAVLEVYGVRQCSDFPVNSTVVFTVQLYDQNRNVISNPGWIGTPAGAGTNPNCNYGLNVTATEETLEY
jgi:hypothetical protein